MWRRFLPGISMLGSLPDVCQPGQGLHLLPQDRFQLHPLLLLGHQGRQSFCFSPEALTRKKVSPSTKRRNARRRAEFLKKKQSSTVQKADMPSGVSISVRTPEQAATSEKPNSSPPRETSRQPPFEFNGGLRKMPSGCVKP